MQNVYKYHDCSLKDHRSVITCPLNDSPYSNVLYAYQLDWRKFLLPMYRSQIWRKQIICS